MPIRLLKPSHANSQSSYSKFLNHESINFQLQYHPGTDTEPELYSVDLFFPDGRPLFHPKSNNVFKYTYNTNDMNTSLEKRCRYTGSTPMAALLETMRAISDQTLISYFIKNNQYHLEQVSIPRLQWDLSVEWCYQQFERPLPTSEEEPPPVQTAPLLRRKP